VICSQSVFGSTIKLLQEFGKFGVETSFVSQTDVAQWRAAVRPNTKLLFAETPTNPLTEVCDIRRWPTSRTRRRAAGGGQLLVLAGAAAAGEVRRRHRHALGHQVPRRPGPRDRRCAVRASRGAGRTTEVRAGDAQRRHEPVALQRLGGGQGLETLSVRVKAQSERALQLARWLEAHPAVERVYYPGLPSHPQHELAMAQQSGSGGAVLSFDVKGGARAAFAVIDATRICSITANFGDVRKTIITHPASTSHGRLSEAQRQAAGIGQGMIRLGVGLEDTEDDLKADLARGLDALNPATMSTSPHPHRARRPPASCTWARRARRCIPGPTRATTAASSCCASRTPTSRARRRTRSSRSSTRCAGWGWTTTRARSTRCSAWRATTRWSSR
jgi:O-succinylhomoserine sulfhydrylase